MNLKTNKLANKTPKQTSTERHTYTRHITYRENSL